MLNFFNYSLLKLYLRFLDKYNKSKIVRKRRRDKKRYAVIYERCKHADAEGHYFLHIGRSLSLGVIKRSIKSIARKVISDAKQYCCDFSNRITAKQVDLFIKVMEVLIREEQALTISACGVTSLASPDDDLISGGGGTDSCCWAKKICRFIENNPAFRNKITLEECLDVANAISRSAASNHLFYKCAGGSFVPASSYKVIKLLCHARGNMPRFFVAASEMIDCAAILPLLTQRQNVISMPHQPQTRKMPEGVAQVLHFPTTVASAYRNSMDMYSYRYHQFSRFLVGAVGRMFPSMKTLMKNISGARDLVHSVSGNEVRHRTYTTTCKGSLLGTDRFDVTVAPVHSMQVGHRYTAGYFARGHLRIWKRWMLAKGKILGMTRLPRLMLKQGNGRGKIEPQNY